MKKILSFAVAGVFVLGMASCKKDYTCTCKSASSTDELKYEYKGVKKKDAESTCDAQAASWKALGCTDCSCSI